MSGYVKIYGSILGSSIWAEAIPTRIVWITMLAMADEHGRVEASTSGLARFANVSLGQCREALKALAAPDSDSRTEEHEGRRVEKVPGGWLILNYRKYREMRSPKQVADAERQKQWRNRDKSDMSQTSTDIHPAVDVAVAVDEATTKAFTKASHQGPATALSATAIFALLLGLIEEHQQPGGPLNRVIPKSAVADLGPDVLLAYEACGGSDRFTAATGATMGFLQNQFVKALSEIRTAK